MIMHKSRSSCITEQPIELSVENRRDSKNPQVYFCIWTVVKNVMAGARFEIVAAVDVNTTANDIYRQFIFFLLELREFFLQVKL